MILTLTVSKGINLSLRANLAVSFCHGMPVVLNHVT